MGLHNRDQFDDLLDGALKRYGDFEPRAGLEGRVLARLAIAQTDSSSRRTWALTFSLVACVCTVLLAAAVTWFRPQVRRVHPPIQGSTRGLASNVGVRASTSEPKSVPPQSPLRHKKPQAVGTAKGIKTLPRLRQFPSDRPLSEQEELLARYVSEFPKDAAEIAREQGRREKELQSLYSTSARTLDVDQER